MALLWGSMGPGYVQGSTRLPRGRPWGPLGEVLYLWNLWIQEVLAGKDSREPALFLQLNPPGR
jgi:hypothetical protein